jgi:hypothetical protein
MAEDNERLEWMLVGSLLLESFRVQQSRHTETPMKRYGNLFDHVVTYDNLLLAYENASKGRKWRKEIMD